jgi:hypothetical protein
MNQHVENYLQEGRQALERLKGQLQGESYQWVEELKRIQFKIDKIKREMEEKKRKAMNEKDPKKRAALLLEIEEDGKQLEKLYKEHQQHSDKFKFNASSYVSNLVEKMKQAIEGNFKNPRGGSSGGSGGGNPNRPNRPGGSGGNDPFGGLGGGNPDDNNNPKSPRGKRQGSSESKDNQQMIFIAIAVALVLFFLMNQKDSSSRRGEYDEFDY